MTKYIVVTGGVISGVSKGITVSSLGLLLQARGYKVNVIKIDGYLNETAGLLAPNEHGECYVLDDGSEVDLDFGNYERFLNLELTQMNSITTGKIYRTVLDNERQAKYLGKTVQIFPHITDEIQRRISEVELQQKSDFCFIEIGGTVDDLESAPFIEAIRQFSFNRQIMFVHVALLIQSDQEYKTRPIQQSIASLRSKGIIPNLCVIRCPEKISKDIKIKLSLFSGLKEQDIISNNNVSNIYFVPENFNNQQVYDRIAHYFKLEDRESTFKSYLPILKYFDTNYPEISIGLVCKYFGQDQYLSIIRALEHSAFKFNIKIKILYINSESYTISELQSCQALIIPGGFGSRGIQGKMDIVKYARENNIAILGICLGFQIMVVEYCKNVLKWSATSEEWDISAEKNVIHQIPQAELGKNMRLGKFQSQVSPNSKLYYIYNSNIINERHRHRYEVNNEFISKIQEHDLKFTISSEIQNNIYQEALELQNHKYFIGCQYHPEYQSKYSKSHPLFDGLLNAILDKY